MLVKPLFADYGAWSHATKMVDHITRQQALQSLSKLGVELTSEEANLLFRRYDTLATGTVNFIALVRDIDPFESFSGRQMRRHAFPQDPEYGSGFTMHGGFRQDRVVPGLLLNLQPGRPPTSNDQPRRDGGRESEGGLGELMERLQRTAVQHRLRVDENLRDFDRHRQVVSRGECDQDCCATITITITTTTITLPPPPTTTPYYPPPLTSKYPPLPPPPPQPTTTSSTKREPTSHK